MDRLDFIGDNIIVYNVFSYNDFCLYYDGREIGYGGICLIGYYCF